jgi:hypothetical protein
MKKMILSPLAFMLALSFFSFLAPVQAQSFQPSFSLPPPAEVARDLFQKPFSLDAKEENF